MRSIVVVGWFLAACAHPARAPERDHAMLTRAQILSVNGATNLYDVIRRLRSDYLTDRGRTSLMNPVDSRPVVFMGDQEYGPIESLRTIQPDAVEEVRFFASTSAVARFGSRYGGGVIQVRLRIS